MAGISLYLSVSETYVSMFCGFLIVKYLGGLDCSVL